MRLRYIYLPDYGPLKEVAVVFEQNPHIENRAGAVNFVVGLNGSGKSSMLRAIYDVFHSLSREELPRFPVSLAYDSTALTGGTVVFHRPRGATSESFFAPTFLFHPPSTAVDWQGYIETLPTAEHHIRPAIVPGDQLRGHGSVRSWLPKRVLAYTSGDLEPWRTMSYPSFPTEELQPGDVELNRDAERPIGWTRYNEGMAEPHGQRIDAPDSQSRDDDEMSLDFGRDRCLLLQPEDARLAAASVGIWQAAQDLKLHTNEAELEKFRKDRLAELDAPKRQLIEGARRLFNEIDWLIPSHVSFRLSSHSDVIPHPDNPVCFWLFALAELVLAQPLNESLAVVRLGHFPTVYLEDLVGEDNLEDLLKHAGTPMVNAQSGAEALCALLSGGKPIEESLWSIFETLRSWRSYGMLNDVQLTVKRIRQVKATNDQLDDRILSYTSFSDGEQMLLGRMAFLLLLCQQDESLLLLDEPETHFNDAWKRQIIDMVDDSILKHTSAQVLVSTHTSLALTDVFSCEITRLVKDQGTTRAERVAHPTFGADPGRILLHVFGAPDVIGARAAEFLRDKLKQVVWSDGEREKLRALVDEIGSGWPRAKLMEMLDDLDGTQPEDLPHVAFDS